MQVFKDIRYADGHVIDVYTPSEPGGGAVLILHCGWFQSDKAEAADIAERLCQAGVCAFVPSYRMPPHTLFSAARGDALAALNWMLRSEYTFDRDHVAVWGFSVGGTLAVEVALAAGVPGVTWSAMIDLKGFMADTASIADKDYDHDFSGLTRDDIELSGRNDPLLRNLVLQLVANNTSWLATHTPLCRVSRNAGPLLMINGVEELVPADGAMALQRALAGVGVPTTVSLIAGKQHGRRNLHAAFPQALEFTLSQFANLPKEHDASEAA
jgi:acetyl esterase/lipase